MRIQFLNNFLTNNSRFKPDGPNYRRACLLNVMFVGLCGICLFYTAANLVVTRDTRLAVIEALMAVLSALSLVYFHKSGNVRAAVFIVLTLSVTFFLLYLNAARSCGYSLFWMTVFPPVIYFLLDRRTARIVMGALCVYIAGFLALRHESLPPSTLGVASALNIAGAMLCLITIVSYFEVSRRDATDELKRANSALADSRESLQLILNSTAEAIYGVDRDGNCTFCNKSCLDLLGCAREEELLGRNMHAVIFGPGGGPEHCSVLDTCRQGVKSNGFGEISRRLGEESFYAEYFAYPQYKNGELIGAVVTFQDITERRRAEEQIRYLSFHDSLTGLINRRRFEEALKESDTNENLPLSVIFADVNGLKLTNDIFGHNLGDTLIRKSAGILLSCCRETDVVARVGGDEFAILLPRTQARDAQAVIERIQAALAGEMVEAVRCSMAFGCDTKTSFYQNIMRIMENAEIMMYKDKTHTRRSFGIDAVNTIMNTLHARSPREKEHSEAVRALSGRLCAALGLPETQAKKIRDAAYLHDIGKIVLNKELLLKNAPLTDREKRESLQHAAVGYRLLNLFDDTLDLAEAVYGHHERWDGMGHPKGLRGTEIPMEARVIAVAEMYDSLIHPAYNKPLTPERALARIRETVGTKLDPAFAEVFLNMMEKEQPLSFPRARNLSPGA